MQLNHPLYETLFMEMTGMNARQFPALPAEKQDAYKRGAAAVARVCANFYARAAKYGWSQDKTRRELLRELPEAASRETEGLTAIFEN